MGNERSKIVTLVGTNASGKSAVGIELAKTFQGEIISADSRQIYKGFDLCCGKVTQEEARVVPHHLLDVREVGEDFSVFDFQQLAYTAISQILQRGRLPFIVGGTGLYVSAVADGYVLSEKPPRAEGHARLAELPKGLDTCLYREFEDDGVEVSGGEAQKIALARVLYQDAPFIVLDEPTAALDPEAEAEVYTKFNDIVEDKTAIYISHRLSSCRFCDEIAVFDRGQVVQQGTHDGLLADSGGKYQTLWDAQAQYYQKKDGGAQ